MLKWRVNILDELKAVGWYPHKIRVHKLFGESTVQKMRRQQLVSWAEFDRLCRVLGKQPGDLIEWVPEGEPEELPEEKPEPSNWYKPNDTDGQSGAGK